MKARIILAPIACIAVLSATTAATAKGKLNCKPTVIGYGADYSSNKAKR